MIEKRLTGIACDENEFNKAAPAYNQALEKSGYKHNVVFQATKPKNQETGNVISRGLTPPLATTFRPI